MSMELVVSEVSKTYPNGVRALHDVSLRIPTGIFGLLGPNGAGKSTLMRTIATLQQPDAGSIRLGEIDVLRDPDAVRRVLGYLPQEFGLYPNLSAELILNHFATLKGVSVRGERKDMVEALLRQVNLHDLRKKRVGGFSGGMKQRLGIAIALVGAPRMIIVDEPTAGLDPAERYRFLNLLADVAREVVVILSTHIVEDVRELCSQMAIIDQGQVVLSGEPGALLERVRGRVWRCTVPRAELEHLHSQCDVISERLVAGRPVVRVYGESSPGAQFEPVEVDLEDLYFQQLQSHRGSAATLA